MDHSGTAYILLCGLAYIDPMSEMMHTRYPKKRNYVSYLLFVRNNRPERSCEKVNWMSPGIFSICLCMFPSNTAEKHRYSKRHRQAFFVSVIVIAPNV